MKVGVYVDAFNLYYGARSHCGRGTAGWRWLDVRALAQSLCGWQNCVIERIVYCTARVDPVDDPSAHTDQAAYLGALKEGRSVDVMELGRYVAWAKTLPLAIQAANGQAAPIRPTGSERWTTSLPIRHQRGKARDGSEDLLLACVRNREEKGSDVNVATHLLADVFTKNVEAAIVISNDSDLALPLRIARTLVPVGTVNPSTKPLAGALRGLKHDGPGRHWWAKLSDRQYRAHQLPDPWANGANRPTGKTRPATWPDLPHPATPM